MCSAELRDRNPETKMVLAGTWLADEGYTDVCSGSEYVAALAVVLAFDDSASMTAQDVNIGGGVMW